MTNMKRIINGGFWLASLVLIIAGVIQNWNTCETESILLGIAWHTTLVFGGWRFCDRQIKESTN